MTSPTFLDQIATRLLKKYSDSFSDTIVILPNKRAKVFLLEALKNQTQMNLIAPNIISIEDFIQDISGIRSIDPIDLLFEFYDVYITISDKSNQQSFDHFASWAKVLLQDFNEIDRYLLNPLQILTYLKDIEDIKKWGVEVENKTDLIENYIDFWKLLPTYYQSLYSHLLNKGIGYQGLIYREAVNNLNFYSETLKNTKFLFAGFNALNKAEETIIKHLIENGFAEIYWDIDQTFLNDVYHDAALFSRRTLNNWSYYKGNPFEWVSNDYSQPKNIQVIGTPKMVGQAKIVGSIIENILKANPNAKLDKVAIVLGDENILSPLLYSIPSTINSLNITMGYSSKNNPCQILISKLFTLHCNAISRNQNSYLMYYKDVLEVLTHPLIEPYVEAKTLVKSINVNNYTFITQKKVYELNPTPNDFFNLLFKKWDCGIVPVLENISEIIITLKRSLNKNDEEEKLTKTFLFSIHQVINKLITYFSKHQQINDVEILHAIYKQIIDLAEVSFEGEPLNGLQIMGVLESRVLDFETVIITSLNEGKFPAGKSQNSFIPYDVKREYELPTFKEKDAIYTYHFYHLLQRAKNVYLLYNSSGDGFDAGEKSRFITQLEVEKHPNHTFSHEIYTPEIPNFASQAKFIEKSDKLMERLKAIAEKGFSPSALTTYIRNPIQFYFQKILRISEVEEVEENIAVNTLGTIIHEALEELYKPFIGKILIENDIKACIKNYESEVLKQFKFIYKEGEIKKGRNLLAFEVAKRNVRNFLNMELESIQNGDEIQIIALEKKLERELIHPSLPFPVKISGFVDRIENRNGTIRIIDYKTGTVSKSNVTLKSWEGLTADIKNDKIIQILAYAFMFEPEAKGMNIEAGIISFKNLKSGFLPFCLKDNKTETNFINEEILDKYQEQIFLLLNEILDKEIPFKESKDQNIQIGKSFKKN